MLVLSDPAGSGDPAREPTSRAAWSVWASTSGSAGRGCRTSPSSASGSARGSGRRCPDLGEVSPSDAAAYHSVLRSGGAQYVVLESFALGG